MNLLLRIGVHLLKPLILLLAAIPSLLFLHGRSFGAEVEDEAQERNESTFTSTGESKTWTRDRMIRAEIMPVPVEPELTEPDQTAGTKRNKNK